MERQSGCSKSVVQDVDSFHDLQSSVNANGSELVSSLECTIKKSLHIEDIPNLKIIPEGGCISDGKEKAVEIPETKISPTCLNKSATFPCSGKKLPTALSSEEDESEAALNQLFSDEPTHQACLRSFSLPAPSRIVSAMKGSRAQQGALPQKLTVKWAPDVYDPPQTSLSHTATKSKKQQKSKNKKNGKKGQKSSNFSRRNGGKEAKQARKVVGGSSRSYKEFDAFEQTVANFKEFDSFEVCTSDTHCGSSFLMQSVTKVHYSVAEAL